MKKKANEGYIYVHDKVIKDFLKQIYGKAEEITIEKKEDFVIKSEEQFEMKEIDNSEGKKENLNINVEASNKQNF